MNLIRAQEDLNKKHPGITWYDVITIDKQILGRAMRTPSGMVCIFSVLDCMIGQYAFLDLRLYHLATCDHQEIILWFENKFYWFSPKEIYESKPALDVIGGRQVIKFPMRLGKNIDKLGRKPEVEQTGNLFE